MSRRLISCLPWGRRLPVEGSGGRQGSYLDCAVPYGAAGRRLQPARPPRRTSLPPANTGGHAALKASVMTPLWHRTPTERAGPGPAGIRDRNSRPRLPARTKGRIRLPRPGLPFSRASSSEDWARTTSSSGPACLRSMTVATSAALIDEPTPQVQSGLHQPVGKGRERQAQAYGPQGRLVKTLGP